MAEDILEQAAQRRMRRTQKNTDKLDDLGDIIQLEASPLVEETVSVGLSRNRRARTSETTSTGSSNDFSLLSVDDYIVCPPFIHCTFNGCDVKALLDTSQGSSRINRKLMDRLNPEIPGHPEKPLNLKLTFNNSKVVMALLHVSDIIPDLTLGCDFMVKQKCIINYEDRSLRIGGSGGIRVDFVHDRDVPLHFRCNNLSASV